jgi:hypothetical protein
MLATMETFRTADGHFSDLPESPYAAMYCGVSDQDGGTLPVAWVEDGPADADPVLMLHGRWHSTSLTCSGLPTDDLLMPDILVASP